MTIAFIAPLAAAAEALVQGPKVTPKVEPEVLARVKEAERIAAEKALVATFHPSYLDARPVIWSLYHHPEEWARHSEVWLRHQPTGHYISSQENRATSDHDCSCHNTYFQSSQREELYKAEQWFRNGSRGTPPDYPMPTIRAGLHADQFAGHFIR